MPATDKLSLEHRRASRLKALLIAALLLQVVVAPAARAQSTRSLLASLRTEDLRLARIADRIATANAQLCDRLEPALGMQLHSIDQYPPDVRDDARAVFGFAAPVAVEGLLPGGPAERAGLREDDAVTMIGAIATDTLPADEKGTEGKARITALHDAIAALPPDRPVPVIVLRQGEVHRFTVAPVPACRSRFELRLTTDYEALADGNQVQISAQLLETYGDEGVAVAVAHELAHNILHHRERLEARGVDFGMLSGLGANVGYFRQTELEADILSISLLANAGYDPEIAPAFWRRFGPEHSSSVFHSPTHPAWRDRVATMEREIAIVRSMSVRPVRSPILATRDQPLDGNWKKLIARATN